MSDQTTSGSASVAPAETVSVPSSPATSVAPAENAAPTPAFGSTKGSGLARGKRPSSTPANATASKNIAASDDYKPTAIQIVTAEREYTNPFAPIEPVAAPVIETPAPVSTSAVAPVAPTATVTTSPAPQAEIKPTVEPVSPAPASPEPAVKAVLKILPPEEKAHPAQSWQSDSFPGAKPSSNERTQRHEDRPIFRTERARREGDARPPEGENRTSEPRFGDQRRDSREPRAPRENREPRQPRDPRDTREPRQPRDPRDARPFNKPTAPAAPVVEEKKSTGFFGWLKSLFTSEPETPETKPSSPANREDGERRFDGSRGGRRHHRGGRGRGGDFQGDSGENRNAPRPEGQAPQGDRFRQGGERRFDGPHGSQGGGRRDHRNDQRGGRGQGGHGNRGNYRGGERRGGDSRPSSDNGGGSGPAAS